ncbi:MAG: hypothetical protein VX498_15780, partial [Myxococcota bacterium]|nr:hypothetical protein [Myxococcota bacterium]
MGALLLLSSCEAPVVEEADYLGMNLHGDRIEFFWDETESSWTSFNRDLEVESEGSFVASPESSLEGFVESDGDLGMAWTVERPGWGLVSTFPTGRGDSSLTWAASTAVEVTDYLPLLTGNHTCLRLREDGSPTDDIGFLTLDEDRFALSLLDSCTTRPENLPFGASTIEAGEGDEEGTWSLGGTNDQEIRLDGEAGTWEGVVFPGYAMALRPHSLEGLLLCLWSPLPNTQLSVYDGDFRFVEYRRQAEEPFGVPGLGTVDVFGEAGELYRRSAAGEEETASLGLRTQVYYVGNLVLWEITEDERIYMAV